MTGEDALEHARIYEDLRDCWLKESKRYNDINVGYCEMYAKNWDSVAKRYRALAERKENATR